MLGRFHIIFIKIGVVFLIPIFNRIKDSYRNRLASTKGSAAYWTVHMVVNETFSSAESSLRYFHWRNAQYLGYIELMPVTGQDGKIVLDYGCGPGNDIIGFSLFSKTSKLYGIDVSPTALEAARKRLDLHNKTAEFILVEEKDNRIPLPENSVDYIHSSGVLHHCQNIDAILDELYRILKPGGKMSVMVYNYSSILLHLYVAYIQQIHYGKYSSSPIEDAFRRLTDGEHCPISRCYKPEDFVSLVKGHRFQGTFEGAAISLTEMKYLEKRFDAMADRRLNEEHRDFLSRITFNNKGIPIYDNHVAGIDACYSFTK